MSVAKLRLAWVRGLVAFATALVVAGCASRGGCGTACDVPEATCCPAPAEPCSPCGPRPAAAKAGEAWCCVWVPPVNGVEEETYCVKPASKRCVWVPPTYGTRIKLVCDAPPKLAEVNKPGVYAQRKRDVLVTPERTTVERVCCPTGDLGPGEAQCECVTKKVTPPVWEEQCERVCLEPERRCIQFTPAQYRCAEERYVISAGFTQEVCEPAQYATRTKQVCIQPGRWEWRKNDKCTVPEQLQALQLEMVDSNPDGTAAGIFSVGKQVRYDVTVTSDTASGSMSGLVVEFKLPAELEFVSGSSDAGATVTGGGQVAVSSPFNLSGDQALKLQLVALVKSAPATESQGVQVTATVRNSAGTELAVETEQSTLKR